MGNVKSMVFLKKFSRIGIKLILITFFIINCSSNKNSEKVEKSDLKIYKNALSLSLSRKH